MKSPYSSALSASLREPTTTFGARASFGFSRRDAENAEENCYV